jgi:hypothetical protein
MKQEDAITRVREQLETIRLRPKHLVTPEEVMVAIAKRSGSVIRAAEQTAFNPEQGPIEKEGNRKHYRNELIDLAADAIWALELVP